MYQKCRIPAFTGMTNYPDFPDYINRIEKGKRMTDQESTRQKLVRAYDNMMEKFSELVEQAEEGADDLVHMLEKARDDAADIDNLTREEAEKISHFVKRDLHNAGQYLEKTGGDLGDWLHMDLELVEWSLLDLFLTAADRTKLDLLLLEENARHLGEYHTGEITGPGTLTCESCGELLHFNNAGHIPPCPRCNATVFKRKSR